VVKLWWCWEIPSILRLPTWESWDKTTFGDLASWLGIKNNIRGKVVASPNPGHGEFYEFVFAHDSFVHQKCSNYALNNLLFGLCTFVWIIDLLVIRPSPHLEASVRPFTFELLWAKEHAPIHYPSIVFTLDSHLSLSRSLGMHHICPQYWTLAV